MTMPRLVPALSSIVSTTLLATVLAACGCASKSAEPKEPTGGTGGPTGGPTGDDVGAFDLSKLGSPCGEADRCEGGTSCTKYYGIAGPSGPEFKSCEVTCTSGKGCPAGTACITIADGPGQVCRATEEQPVP